MPIGIAGQSYLDIRIEDMQLPLERMRFQKLLLTSHILYHMPMGELVFLDTHDIVTTTMTTLDSSYVQITLGKDADRAYRYSMKIFNTTAKKTDEGTLYTITLIDTWDIWRLGTAKGALSMSSSQALAALAETSRMQFVGSPTNDSQVWLPMAESYAMFARRIAGQGYVDGKSCMAMGVSLSGELRYANLNAIDLSKPVYEFVHGIQRGIWVTDWRVKNNAGTANQGGGYATTSHQFNTVDGSRSQQDKVQLQRKTNVLNVNSDARAAAGSGKMLFSPIDAGNNHANSQLARYQNKRVSQLLSTSASVVTPYDPNVDILEPVLFSNFIMNRQGSTLEVDPKTSGVHIVAGKAIFLGSDLMYNERYQLIREGHNVDNSGKVL